MPIYTWRCKDCDGLTEVERAMRDYEVPPESCGECGLADVVRILTPPKLMPQHEHDVSLVRERKFQQSNKTARGRRGKGRFTHTTGVK